ncbi:hypothetical protein TUM20984_44490 [Mycobacterium antarcticum]|nr:hypothetical protein TUM20984_44490 [Mycolicibacterium sp. TUM20984]
MAAVSARILAAITDALGIASSDLAPPGDPMNLVRADQRPITVIGGGVTYEELVVGHRALEPAILTIPPHCDSGGTLVRPGETFVHVLNGTVTFTLPPSSELIEVHANDSLTIFAATPHIWHNRTPRLARCLWVELFISPTA